MDTTEDKLAHVKERMRSTWMAGDFGQIARYIETCAAEFVARLDLKLGMRVLDVACGTGNLALPAARAGARVSGLDIAPNLLEQARIRAASEGLDINFVEGDAERLTFPDGEFDVVMTMFGAMFAPRPEVAASEMARVCKPGGRIAMANWTPQGFTGKMFSLGSKYIPPPKGVPAPVQWGDEAMVHDRLGPYASDIRCTRQMAIFDYEFTPREVVGLFREFFGPTKVAFSRLDAAGQEAYERDLIQLWAADNQASKGRTLVPSEYLEVIAVRRTER